jgi:hypothetical protein
VDLPHSPVGAPTRYYPPRLKLLLHTLTAWLIGAIFLVPALNSGGGLAGFGWFVAVLMALAGLVLLLRALRPGPTVMIDNHGITDRTTIAPTGLVQWEEIIVIRKKEIGRGMGAERLLEIMLADPAEFHSRPRSWLRRLSDRYRAALRQPRVSIPGSMVSLPLQALMDEIRQRRPQLQLLEGPPPAPPKFHLLRRKQPPGRRHPELPRW